MNIQEETSAAAETYSLIWNKLLKLLWLLETDMQGSPEDQAHKVLNTWKKTMLLEASL